MSFSDAQETAVVEACFGIGSATIPVATHLAMCTANPEAGTGVSSATRVARGTWTTNGTQQSGRREVSNSAQVVFTNDSGGSIDVTHIAAMTAITAGAVVAFMTLPGTLTVPNGATLTYDAGELTFQVG